MLRMGMLCGALVCLLARAPLWAADAALHRTPLLRAVQTLSDGGNARRSAGALRETETQRALLHERVDAMVGQPIKED